MMIKEILEVADKIYGTDFAQRQEVDHSTFILELSVHLQETERPHVERTLKLCDSIIAEPSSQLLTQLQQIYINSGKFSVQVAIKPGVLEQAQGVMNQNEAANIITPINMLSILVFSTLQHTRTWPTMCKQRNRQNNNKQVKLKELMNWFYEFGALCGIKSLFDLKVLSKKQLKSHNIKVIKDQVNQDLIQAAKDSDYDKVRKLLEEGVNIESLEGLKLRGEGGVHSLRSSHYACQNGDLKMCMLLSEFKADWEAEDSEKMSPIFYAIQSGSLELVKYLVETMKVDLEKKQVQNRTPFYWACTQGDMQIIRYLYQRGADINAQSDLGRTALSKACYLGRVDIVQFLMTCKNINLKCADRKGRTALHNAVFGPKGGRQGHKFGTSEKDSPECAQLLLEAGADVNQQDKDGNTSFHIALSSEALGSIPVLIAYGGNIEIRNKFGQTALMVGAKFDHLASVKLMVEEYGSNLFARDINGANCLVVAASEEGVNSVFGYICPKFIERFLKNQKDKLAGQEQLRFTLQKLVSLKSSEGVVCFYYNMVKLVPQAVSRVFTSKIIQEIFGRLKEETAQLFLKEKSLLDTECIKKILHQCFISKKQHLFERIFANFQKQLEQEEFDFQYFWAAGLDTINDKFITLSITHLNLDIVNLRQSETHKNILHLLVDYKKLGTLIQVLKMFSKAYHGPMKNKHLINATAEELEKSLQMLLEEVDAQTGMTASQACLVRKNMDLYKILEGYVHKDQKQHFKIEDVRGLVSKDQQELELFKLHEKQADVTELINLYSELSCQDIRKRLEDSLTNQQHKIKEHLLEYKGEQLKQFYIDFKKSRKFVYAETSQSAVDIIQAYFLNFEFTSVVAIDLEYFLCPQLHQSVISTLQLSCTACDLVLDCLRIPLNTLSKLLAPIFHDIRLLKILHGCEQDLLILKSCFNLSLVHLVDTARVAMILTDKTEMPGLKSMVESYLHGIVMSKEYQTSQWRLRPLPTAMLEYARGDSLNLLLLYLRLTATVPAKKIQNLMVSNQKVSLRNRSTLQLIRQIEHA